MDGTGRKRAGRGRRPWAVPAGTASYFLTRPRRGEDALHALGGGPSGAAVSDRRSAYRGLPLERRRACWAHLKRDPKAVAEAGGKAGEVGGGLLTLTGPPSAFGRKARDGTRQRPWPRPARTAPERVRPEARGYPQEGASCGHGPTGGGCAEALEAEEAS